MKNTISFLLLIMMMPSLVFGQVVEPPPSDSIDSQFETPTNLTDKEMENAKNFVHQGERDRVIKEGCAQKDAKNCTDEEGMPIEMMIGKAYALLGVISGNKLKARDSGTPAAGADTSATTNQTANPSGGTTTGASGGAAGGEAKKDKTDYCSYAAMAYESVGGIIQQSLQKQADNTATNEGDAQLQALVSLQQTHKARQKTAKFQQWIYGGVTACYGAMAATGASMKDPMFIAKMGGAAALTYLYNRKAKKHENAANAVGKVIESLDWAGKNCNPWTKTACFCKELTSKTIYPAEYQEVCVLNAGNFETPKVNLGCAAVAANKVSYDKECKCKATNSCMKSPLKAYTPKFGMGANLMNDANKTFDLLGAGDFDQGKLDEASLRQAALASRVKGVSGIKLPQPKLSEEEKKIAEELKKYMPENVANFAAAQPPANNSGVKESSGSSAISKLPTSVKDKLADAIKVGYNKGGGNGFGGGSNEPELEMPVFPGQQPAKSNSTEVLSFAEQAVSKADVSNAPETPIFDIISNRYRRSGWNKLERFE